MRRARERDIAFVFQLFALYPHMNVRKNIGFPLLAQGMPAAEIRAARRGGGEAAAHRPSARTSRSRGLAGGDRQRVALGRAIVRRPKCFLMDEPLGTLDTEFRDLMVHELRELHNRIHATTVYVTHDQMEAMSMADKIAVMNHGVIEQFGTPQEIYDRPATMFVADFIGSPPMNFLTFHGGLQKGAREIVVQGATVAVPEVREDVAPGEMALGVRPEHIRFDDASKLRGSVYGTEYLGTTQIVAVETADGMIKARVPADIARRARARPVGLALNAARLSLFDKASGRAIRTALHDGGAPWLTSVLQGVTKSFGAVAAVARPRPAHRRRRVRRAARADRRRQDDDAAADRRAGEAGRGHASTSAAATPPQLAPAARDVAFVFQQYSLYPHLSVFDNLAFPLRSPARRMPRGRDPPPRRGGGRSWCASTTSSRTARPSCPAARCSASPSAARWCASRRST